MNTINKIFLLLLICSNAYAVNVCPDTDGATVERIYWDETTVRSGCLLLNNSENPFLSSVKRQYLKISGNTVVQKTQGEIDAIVANDALVAQLALRNTEKATYDMIYLKSLIEILINEINSLRGWTVSLKAEIAASTSLADLKTRAATLPTLDNRTIQQLRTALESKIDELTP